jgi:hypothetical protein
MGYGPDHGPDGSPALSECDARVNGAMATVAPGFAALNAGLRIRPQNSEVHQ